MKPSAVISHIVLSVILIACIICVVLCSTHSRNTRHGVTGCTNLTYHLGRNLPKPINNEDYLGKKQDPAKCPTLQPVN